MAPTVTTNTTNRPIQASPKPTLDSVDKANFLLLFVACLALFFVGLGSWGFIDPGDGYFSEASREMMERGNYIVPYLNYQIYFSKPILIYWMIIPSYKLFGINEFAARFSSAALATALVLCIYWTTRCLSTKRAGLMAAIAAGSCPLVVTFARMSLIDMGFASLLGISLCATAMTLFTQSKKWWPVIYIALGLSVLDKGPAAAILYAICLFGYVVASRPNRAWIKDTWARLHAIPGLVIFAAISVPWYVMVGLSTNWLWTKVFFLFENFGRFAGHTNHRVPYPWFYLPVIAYGFFPWVLFLPLACVAPAKEALARWRNRATAGDASSINAKLLFAAWAGATLLLFSASQTKLQTYILPAFPAMAVLVGMTLDECLTAGKDCSNSKYLKASAWLIALFGVLAFAAVAAGSLVMTNPAILSSLHLRFAGAATAAIGEVSTWLRIGLIVTFATTGIGLWRCSEVLRRGATKHGIACLGATAVTACAIGSPIAYHIAYQFKNADVHKVIATIKDKPGPVALFRDFKPSVVYHLQRPVDTFFSVDQLKPRTGPSDQTTQYVIAGPKGAADLLAAYPSQLQTVAHSGDWYVFATNELTAVRLPTLEQSFTQGINLGGGEFSWGTLPFAGGTKP